MKKRYLIICLALGLVLTGCSSTKSDKAGDTTDKTSVISQESTESSSEAEEENQQEAPDESETEIAEEEKEESEQQKEETPVAAGTLNQELADIEKKAEEITAEIQDAQTQTEMNEKSGELYSLWDGELNSLWERFSNQADKDYKALILEEQRTWIKEKEQKIKEAGASVEGGTMQSQLESLEGARVTRNRVYQVAYYLGQVIGESVEFPKYDVAGEYVDTQGTAEAYSKLILVDNGDNTFSTTVSIYRLTEFEGTVEDTGRKLIFTDSENRIIGEISIDPENESAVFVVTESNWDLAPVGEVWEFDQKW